jgi:YesN/AraC family two-component response regulator
MKPIPVRSIQPKAQTKVADSFKIRSVQEVLAGKNMSQDLHRHDFYFILAVSKGRGLHEIDFTEHAVSDHTIFFMRPGQVHQLQLKAGSEGFIVEFDKDFQRSSLLPKAANRNYCKLARNEFDTLCTPLKEMLAEYQLQQDGYENVIKANFEIFLTKFLRFRKEHEPNATKTNIYQQEKLQEFMDLLEKNISTTKQVTAYADLVHLSPFQLNSITKSLVGKTVAELIEGQILLEAKRYLLATSSQVNQIALELGYEDVSYFIRFFKKLTGHTPEAFRKNFR